MLSLCRALGREGSTGLGSGPGGALFLQAPTMPGSTLPTGESALGFPEAYIKSSGLVQPLMPPVTECWKVQTHQACRASFPGWADVLYP